MSELASQRLFPRLYPIVDEDVLARHGLGVRRFAERLKAAGVELLQYRNKLGRPQEVLRNAAVRDCGPDMVTTPEGTVPCRAPEKLVNCHAVLGFAVTCTVVPAG